MQATKDREINRLSSALYHAQRDADDAKRRLEQVHTHAVAMQDQHRDRQDALAELADLEGQLAQTQVYNHHMANEMISLQKQVRNDKWELLHEMSSLERQLDAARAMHSIGVDGGTMATGGEGGDDTLQSDANNKALPPVTAASRVEEITRLHAVLVQERGEVAAAMRVLNEQHGELEFALKRVAEETASIRGAEAVRAASSEERHRELQSVAHDLEEKIGAIRTAARIGLDSASESATAKSNELVELEAIVTAAAEDVSRIEQRLGEQTSDELSMSELNGLRASLAERLMSLDEQSLERLLEDVAGRKDGAMQAVAQQLVPQMNELQTMHDAERARLERLLRDGERSMTPDDRSRLLEQMEAQAKSHDAQLATLEAKAAEALASLEESFEAEVEKCGARARTAAAERQRVGARLEGIEARIRGLSILPATPGATMDIPGADTSLSFSRNATPQRLSSAVDPGAAVRTLARGGGGAGGRPLAVAPTEWITERLAFFFQESADQAIRRALSKWQVNASYLAGLAASHGPSGGYNAAWAQARAEKVALVRQMDEQAQQLSHASMALALKADAEVVAAESHAAASGHGALPTPEMNAALASLRQELRNAHDKIGALEQQNSMMHQELSTLHKEDSMAAADGERGGTKVSFVSPNIEDAVTDGGSRGASDTLSVLDLQVQGEQAAAELKLEREENGRLRQLVDTMKSGELSSIFRQAQQEAEKEVLRRMLSSNIEL